ncbi:hypothetical protein VB780_08110 [Leptolyngbya sp. CCNP1308]|uniref:hypothetical protein n=1 Tax=Leptolyngbya sp. CCNP1308 TaxID=3110255 RepID=UPI002B20837C|nr:hypothetical protein [Leptolyngbya sp. CCNP1308]MEA5448525.1 hypothetical protein [Leptolyngbya sp. CCNP1308]
MAADKDDLAIWLDQQQGAPLTPRQLPPEIHLHQHYYGLQQPTAQPREPRYSRARAAREPIEIGPRLALLYVFVGAISLAVVLAALGAVIDSLNRPSVQYVQPSWGGW